MARASRWSEDTLRRDLGEFFNEAASAPAHPPRLPHPADRVQFNMKVRRDTAARFREIARKRGLYFDELLALALDSLEAAAVDPSRKAGPRPRS